MIGKIIRYLERRFYSPEKYGKSLGMKIGSNCLISTKKFPSEAYLIEIGNYCRIASGVAFFTHGGLWSQRKKHGNLDYFGRIKVGNYTYIGEDSKIMPGVEIGNDVIIGAGTVVTKSIPSGYIVAGNPCRVVGQTQDFVDKIKMIDLDLYGVSYSEKKNKLLATPNEKFVRKNLIKKL